MKIDHERDIARNGHKFIRFSERAVERGHKDTPLQVRHHQAMRSVLKEHPPLARTGVRIVRRADDSRLRGQHRDAFALVPDMVARGHSGDPHRKQLIDYFLGYAFPRGGILAVGEDEIKPSLALRQLLEKGRNSLSSRASHDIADKKNLHIGYFAYSVARVSFVAVTFI